MSGDALNLFSTGAEVVGAGIGIAGDFMQSRAQEEADLAVQAQQMLNAQREAAFFRDNAEVAQYNRARLTQNAEVAAKNAAIARDIADADAEIQERQARLRLGANIAAVGGSGVQLVGSALDAFEDNALEEQLQIKRILFEGEMRAEGFASQARDFLAQADLEDLKRQQALNAASFSEGQQFQLPSRPSPLISAAGRVLSTGVRIADRQGAFLDNETLG